MLTLLLLWARPMGWTRRGAVAAEVALWWGAGSQSRARDWGLVSEKQMQGSGGLANDWGTLAGLGEVLIRGLGHAFRVLVWITVAGSM